MGDDVSDAVWPRPVAVLREKEATIRKSINNCGHTEAGVEIGLKIYLRLTQVGQKTYLR